MTLREFLEARERELVDEIGTLRGDLVPKEAELAEIRRAKVAIGMLHRMIASSTMIMEIEAPNADQSGKQEVSAIEAESASPYAGLTMKQLVVKALMEHFHKGATTRQLLDFFRDAWNRDISRASLTPQLSRLFQDRIIDKTNDHYWFLLANHEPMERRD
jgi:hypothetical protein